MPVFVISSLWVVDFAYTKSVQPVLALWAWLYVFYFLGGFGWTGPYVSMLWEVIVDMLSFFAVLLLVIFGLGHTFALAARNHNIWNQLQRVYRMGILVDFELDDYDVDGQDLETHPLLYICFVLVTVVLMITMLNLLIAVISDTFDRVKENMTSRLTRSRAARIAELERAYGRRQVGDHYLMFLRPANNSDVSDWQGRVGYLSKTIPNKVKEMMKEQLGHIQAWQDKLQGELQDVHGELQHVQVALRELKELKEMPGKLQELHQLLQTLHNRSLPGSSAPAPRPPIPLPVPPPPPGGPVPPAVKAVMTLPPASAAPALPVAPAVPVPQRVGSPARSASSTSRVCSSH